MFSVENFIASYRKESAICVHLFSRIPSGGLEYRPTPGQRSTLELLRYLTVGPANGVRRVLAGDWTLGRPAAEASKNMPPSDFVRVMQMQTEDAMRELAAFDPLRLMTETFTFPWGETLSKGEGLVNAPLKWLVGYRMQLFLYLKSAGAKDLGTRDVWHLPKE